MHDATPTILVADDEEMVLKFVGLVLKRAGFAVRPAACGADALKLALENPEPPDLAVLDLMMPGMDGAQLYDRLRDLHPNLRVLFMSGYNEEEINRRCGGRVENADLLKKPFTSAELLARVRKMIDRPLSFRA
jgi:two-component system, cell cycle sensor histidine kinase and response regulator CckA